MYIFFNCCKICNILRKENTNKPWNSEKDGVFKVSQLCHFYVFNLAHLAAGEGQLPCLKYLVSTGVNPMHVLGARNDQGETPKDLAQQFYKDVVVEYINGIEWERDHPEEAESESSHPTDTEKHCSLICVYIQILL